MRLVLRPALAAMALVACGSHPPPSTPTVQSSSSGSTDAKRGVYLTEALETSFARWEKEGASGDDDHKARLGKLAAALRARLDATKQVDVVFVCTHNSRRSHMAQLLGLAAARKNGLTTVRTFSGGTEATAFNERAVGALRRVGFEITPAPAVENQGKNLHYSVRFAQTEPVVDVFSKRFADPPNPTSGFVVVMTCSQADAACPVVEGAVARVAIPYNDPKSADGTPEETARYDERVAQIGRDLAWVFSTVAKR